MYYISIKPVLVRKRYLEISLFAVVVAEILFEFMYVLGNGFNHIMIKNAI